LVCSYPRQVVVDGLLEAIETDGEYVEPAVWHGTSSKGAEVLVSA